MPEGSGFFYPATVLDYVPPQCRVYHEETFGPVAPLFRFTHEEEAIAMANDTDFGLASYFLANRLLPLGNADGDTPPDFVATDPGSARLRAALRLVFGQEPRIALGLGTEIAEQLGRKVHLFLHVKVKPDWDEDRSVYRDMGLDWVD